MADGISWTPSFSHRRPPGYPPGQTPRPRRQVFRTTEAIFNATRARALDLLADLGETPNPAERTLPLYEFMLASPLA